MERVHAFLSAQRRAHVFFAIRPEAVIAGTKQHDRALGKRAVGLFPVEDVLRGKPVIAIGGRRFGHVDHGRRSDKALKRDLVGGLRALREMLGRVEMSPAMF